MANRSEESVSESPTFVARLWLEKGPGPTLSWRGRVKHVQGDREVYFATLDELRAFLDEIAGVKAPPRNHDREGLR